MRWFQALMPREEKFVELYCAHAATLVNGAAALRRLLDGGPGIAEACREINAHEEAADLIARDLLLAVRRTFITPFDRTDIKELASQLDDSIDQMKKTAKAVTQFEVANFEPEMRQMGDLIVRCAAITAEAMPLLRHLGRNAARLNAMSEEITKLEEQADTYFDDGMKNLFLKAKSDNDAMAYIVGAEIYDHLEKVVDRFEDVANRISGILIENL